MGWIRLWSGHWLHTFLGSHEYLMRITLFVNENKVAELSDEEVEDVFLEWVDDKHPESSPTDDDYFLIIPTDF